MRGADDEDAAAVRGDPGVGVEQVGGAVQGDHGLARSGAAVDHERALGAGADDRVLVGLDRAEHVPHPLGAVGAEAGDERGLVVERERTPVAAGLEQLVPVVDDPAPGPAVAAAAAEPHRLRGRRGEERLSRRRAPVDEEPFAVGAGEPDPADVARFFIAVDDDAPEAGVDAVAPERAEPALEPVHLEVASERSLTVPGR